MTITNLHAEYTRRLNTGDYSHKEAKVSGSCETPEALPTLRDLLIKTASEMVGEAPVEPAAEPTPAASEVTPASEPTASGTGAGEAPPFVQAAAPTEQQAARPSFAQPEATVSPLTPATTGTEGGSGPFAGQAVSEAQPAPEPASTAAGISDEELTALSIEQAKRINGILPQQGGNIVNQVIARYVQPPRGLKSIPVEQRAAYVAELQAWSPA